MWGEGEFSLLSLTSYLDDKEEIKDINNIPNLAYRDGNQCVFNSIRNKFISFENCEYDYSEFFEEFKHRNITLDLSIPVEGEEVVIGKSVISSFLILVISTERSCLKKLWKKLIYS